MIWTKLADKRPANKTICVVREVYDGFWPDFNDYAVAKFHEDGPDWEFDRCMRSAHDSDEYIVIE